MALGSEITSQMFQPTSASGLTAVSMVKGRCLGRMAQAILESTGVARDMDRESSAGPMADHTLVNGQMTRWKAQVCTSGQMAVSTRGDSLMMT